MSHNKSSSDLLPSSTAVVGCSPSSLTTSTHRSPTTCPLHSRIYLKQASTFGECNSSTPKKRRGDTRAHTKKAWNNGGSFFFHAPPNPAAELDLRRLFLGVSHPRNSLSRLHTPSSSCVPPSLILDFLYLGSVHDAKDAAFLLKSNVQCIINVSNEEYWSVSKDVVVHPFRINDVCNADITPLFLPTLNLIEKVRHKYFAAKEKNCTVTPRVLVHCQKGISRSATIVLAYLIKRHGWSMAEALQYVRRRRPGVEPNLGFLEALRNLQESMDLLERTKRYSSQSLLIKNLPSTTSASAVRNFFETHLGCVKEVTVYSRPPPGPSATPRSEGGPSAEEYVYERSQDYGMETNDDRQHLHAALETTHKALSLVFFACFENVKFAKDYAEKHAEQMVELGVVPGKAIRFIVPSKLKTPSALRSSFTNPQKLTCDTKRANIVEKNAERVSHGIHLHSGPTISRTVTTCARRSASGCFQRGKTVPATRRHESSGEEEGK